MDFETALKEKHGITLNPQQQMAVHATEGPVLLLAVPGSGKTTVVAARTAYMVLERGIPPESILTLTFNRSARLDMEARFRSLFGDAGVRFATIHSFCFSVLREYGQLTGRKVPQVLEGGKARVLRAAHARFNGSQWLPDDRLDELENAVGYAKNRMMTDEQIRDGRWEIRHFPEIFAAYEAWKNENGCLDFDDMLDKAWAAFRASPALLSRVRARWRYVSVDEAQDVSLLQHEIVRLIAAPANNLFLVGDEDQSIYGFRAADPERLLRFQELYPGGRVLKMEHNYRSAKPVVDAANRLIRRNKVRHDKHMAPSAGSSGPPVRSTELSDAALIPAHVAAWAGAAGGGTKAVLYRENGTAAAVMDALDRAGIPLRVREHREGFFSHPAVRDALSFLALAHDPADMQALRQIYWKLDAAVSREQFDRATEIMQAGRHRTALGALMACPGLKAESVTRLKAIGALLAELTVTPNQSAIPFMLDRLGYRQTLKKAGGEGFGTLSALHALSGLHCILTGVDSREALLRRVGELSRLAGRTPESAAVTLSTVHSAKGLEFDDVLVLDLVEGRFPCANAVLNDTADHAAMEEERRLFYVALTRARSSVELVTASSVLGMKMKPSRFIREAVGDQLLRRALESHLKKPPAGSTAPASLTVEIGMEVRHKSFGTGVVTAHDEAHGDVSVRFPKYGVKIISEEFCRGEGKSGKRQADEDV